VCDAFLKHEDGINSAGLFAVIYQQFYVEKTFIHLEDWNNLGVNQS